MKGGGDDVSHFGKHDSMQCESGAGFFPLTVGKNPLHASAQVFGKIYTVPQGLVSSLTRHACQTIAALF